MFKFFTIECIACLKTVFKGDSESCKVVKNDAAVVFIKDDLDFIDFHEYASYSDPKWKSLLDYVVLIKRCNREFFDLQKLSNYKIVEGTACSPPRR